MLDPTKKALSLAEEFKAFALKGNVVDLAVGVVIGTAFGKIVTSLVNHIIMPAIAFVLPAGPGYEGWVIGSKAEGAKNIPVGLFLADIVNFIIVALALFLFIKKFLGFLLRNRKEEAAAPPPLTTDQQLLTEIRDLLQKQTGKQGS
ncbi:MAG: large conductance mechanosensitive channel protein MscL [Pirellulales bacterium]